jgi:hypothetical protein
MKANPVLSRLVVWAHIKRNQVMRPAPREGMLASGNIHMLMYSNTLRSHLAPTGNRTRNKEM